MPGGEGLSYYNARWYDAQLGRFVSADTLVPELGNPQDLNRMAYVRGNPLNHRDPSGHVLEIGGGPLWPAQYIFGNGIGQVAFHPAEQGIRIREQVKSLTNRNFYVPDPVYTASSEIASTPDDPSPAARFVGTGVDIINVLYGSISDLRPGAKGVWHYAARNMIRIINDAVEKGNITIQRGQTIHLVLHSGGGAYGDDLAQHLVGMYGAKISTITLLGVPIAYLDELSRLADDVYVVTAPNDGLGLMSYEAAHEAQELNPNLLPNVHLIMLSEPVGHTGYKNSSEVIELLSSYPRH